MKGEFLLEIGSEEIPARAMDKALNDLGAGFEELLTESDLEFDQVRTLGTARRLVVHVPSLTERQKTRKVTTLGPPNSIAFEDGKPSRALEGFARKAGVGVDDLSVFDTERGEYMGFESEVGGRMASEILSEGIPGLVRNMSFPKMMYWTDPGQRFVRPIRWVVALFDGTVIPLELYGVSAGTASDGHRVLGSRAIRVSGFDDYLRKLEQNYVLVAQDARRQKIEFELERDAVAHGGRIIADAALLEEVVFINEFPSVVAGEFDSRFLELPREILITVMRVHLKYFGVEDADGALLPYFLAVMNTKEDVNGRIRKGHERVLRARLADALFFWEVDGKKTLEERREGLGTVVFQKELGSYSDKLARLLPMAASIDEMTGAGVAPDVLADVVGWSKSDLMTDLVGEFPNMQGVIGGLLARREGASEEVWRAIYEQYRPASLEDSSPRTMGGVVLSLADRLDTLIGCFSIGAVPTGSEDPLGLRRHTQAVIKMLLDHDLPFSMRVILESDRRLDREGQERLLGFYEDRLRFILGRAGFAYDEINAAIGAGSDSPVDVQRRVEALHDVRESPDMVAIAGAFKRIKNILLQSAKKGEGLDGDTDRREMEAEEQALEELVDRVEPLVAELAAAGEYRRALDEMAGIRATVDAFFDRILVMHEDDVIRRRRLKLLKRLFDSFLEVADVSEVVV